VGKVLVLAGLALLLATGYQTITCGCTRRMPASKHARVDVCPTAAVAAHETVSLRLCPGDADREHLRLTQQQFDGLPLTLLAQLLTAVAVCALGGLNVSGTLRPIRVSDVPK
jgi:hypothetical protein